jgi:hypothetical protein
MQDAPAELSHDAPSLLFLLRRGMLCRYREIWARTPAVSMWRWMVEEVGTDRRKVDPKASQPETRQNKPKTLSLLAPFPKISRLRGA